MTLSLLQQLGASLLTLAFGVLALAAWRRAEGTDRPGLVRAWAVTAGSFIVIGTMATLQNVLSTLGVVHGPGSDAWAFAVEWGAAANMARGAAGLALPVLLLVHASARPGGGRRAFRLTAGVTAGIALAGTLAARRVHDGTIYQHFTVLAVVGAALSVSMFAVLLVALARDALDRLLWLALAAYALKEVISVSVVSIFAWWSMAAHPAAIRVFYWLSIATGLAMCVLAARRLALARAGRPVPALFERVAPVRPGVIG